MSSGEHSDRAHATLGASGAYRWMACPGSIALCDGVEDRPSRFALEGTAAHELAERCLRGGFLADRFIGYDWSVGGEIFRIDEAFAEAVQLYLDNVRESVDPGDTLLIEHRFDLSEHVYPGMFGTNDACVYKPKTGRLVVVDLKFGRGVPVEAAGNPQLMYYALGALLTNPQWKVREVVTRIVQPRCPHPDGAVREAVIPSIDLLDFDAELVAAAKRTEQPDAPLVPGEHCKFCPARAFCSAREKHVLDGAGADFDPVDGKLILMPANLHRQPTLLRALSIVDQLEGWCRDIRDFAHHEAEAGRCPPGYKLVGTRTNRRWKDEEKAKAFLLLDYGCEPADIHQPPKFKSPAQIEALIGKKNKADIADLWEQPPSSGTVLVPIADPRPPAKPEAIEDFSEVAALPATS